MRLDREPIVAGNAESLLLCRFSSVKELNVPAKIRLLVSLLFAYNRRDNEQGSAKVGADP